VGNSRKHIWGIPLRLDTGQDASDRRIIASELRRAEQEDVRYEHVGKSEEPLLWIADAIAWSYGRGGRWREEVRTLTTVLDLRGQP